jgi:endonuclease and methylase llaGI
MIFDNLVAQINGMAETQRDRGIYFEHLAHVYFQNEPTYQNEFKNVWMLADVPTEYRVPQNDYSADGKYFFNLLLRIINVSIQTVDLVNSLHKFKVEGQENVFLLF